MGNFLRDLFTKAEAHTDPYIWGCVYGAHLGLSMIAWVFLTVITGDPHRATEISLVGYFVFEAFQFLRNQTKTILLDCIVDWISWASMALALYEIWGHDIINALGYAGGALVIMMVGAIKRLKNVNRA